MPGEPPEYANRQYAFRSVSLPKRVLSPVRGQRRRL